MAKRFKKTIVTEGNHLVSIPGGGRKLVRITSSDLKQWAETGTAMLMAGLKIPAPWKHDLTATPVEVGNDGSPPVPYENAGFWEQLVVGVTSTGKACLEGILEAPGDETDPRTPAYQVGNLVRDTSIYARPEFIDGKGRVWRNAPLHIAVCHNPIEAGQENFQPLVGDQAIAMSQIVDSLDASIDNLLSLLPKIGVTLPEGTTEQNLLERLTTALTALTASGDGPGGTSNPLTRPVKGSEYVPMPIVMAVDETQLDAILAANIVNPLTKKPFAKEDFKGEHMVPKTELDKISQVAAMMSQQAQAAAHSAYEARVKALVDKQVITPEYANTKLSPLFAGIAMNNGSFSNPGLDLTLDALEAIQAPASKPTTVPGIPLFMAASAPQGSTSPSNPLDIPDGDSELSAEEADKIVKGILACTR
jgi:hypothetical protein